MRPQDIIGAEHPDYILFTILDKLHKEGPIEQEDFETLAYLKLYHPDVFSHHEPKLLYLLGLFYKVENPKDLFSVAYSIFQKAIQKETGQFFTPVQASIRNNILQHRYFSFSAPTSAGKSFLFRELIRDEKDDIVIVVPSRALLAEYLIAVRELLIERKDILILQFIDDVNRLRTTRRIFIVTPERASELFKKPQSFIVSLFLYDEAHISEEKIRGLSFDALIRRVERVFPMAKKVFAHPFVSNPEAQLLKHSFHANAGSMAYRQNAVGKMYLHFDKVTGVFEGFSPFISQAHLPVNKVQFTSNLPADLLRLGKCILVYISKSSIYDKSFEAKFAEYISLCNSVEDPEALSIIEDIKQLIGSSDTKHSNMIELMHKGVVIHHGSIPLTVRFLIEKFTNQGYARICFATSTLVQGVNMPFDLVWVDNMSFNGSREDITIGLKNLVGRAGRTSKFSKFDLGYVVVSNIEGFVKKFNGPARLSEVSQLDADFIDLPEDLSEFVEAIKTESFNDEYNLPEIKIRRLKSEELRPTILRALELLFLDGEIINGDSYKLLPKTGQRLISDCFKIIFQTSLGRDLLQGEKSVLTSSIAILLWQIQGKSFRQLLGSRHSYLTRRIEQRGLRRQFKNGEITNEECSRAIRGLNIRYTPIATQLPKSTLTKAPSRFKLNESVDNLNYDLLVYDTYDYIDKVISFSLADVFSAAFGQYFEETGDIRARSMVNYFKYGTDDITEIWLLRYGFSFEDIEILTPHVKSIDENEIKFYRSIKNVTGTNVVALIDRYI